MIRLTCKTYQKYFSSGETLHLAMCEAHLDLVDDLTRKSKKIFKENRSLFWTDILKILAKTLQRSTANALDS